MPEIDRISIVAPAYNEADGIEAVVRGWMTWLLAMPELTAFEIVVCNDGSRDDTGAILDRLAGEFPQVRPVHLPKNRGAAVALRTAIQASTLDWVLLEDSDGQFPIDNLKPLRDALLASGRQAAHGYRRRKQDTLPARLGSWASGALCNRIMGTRYRDFNCALRLVAGPLLRSLVLEARGLNYSTDIMARLIERGVVLTEVPIKQQSRTHGRSSMKLWRDSQARALFVFYLWIRQGLLRRGVIDPP